jgi:hypothetical protein
MSTDAGSPIAPRPLFSTDLPNVVGLTIRRIAFHAPKLEHFKSSLERYTHAIEFIVETDGEVPARAYGPALFVGDVEVHNSERIDKTTWRFLQFETDRLKNGAPIAWGWMKDPKKSRVRTKFRYGVAEDTDAASAKS